MKIILNKIENKFIKLILSLNKLLWHFKLKLSKEKRPSSHPYISSDTFRLIADYTFDKVDKFSSINKTLEGDIIWVNSLFIKEFFKIIHPQIKKKYILITHQGIEAIDDNMLDYLDDKIIHWFAKNVLIENEKITPLPIGLENLWKHGTGIIKLYNKKSKGIKKNKILYHFKIATNPKERQKALDYISKHPMAETYGYKLPPPLYLKKLRKYKFVLSPPGAGEECHRTWEAIYSGVIPIVKSSVATEYFFKLGAPMWVVKDWGELDNLDEIKLNNKYIEIIEQSNKEVVYMDYWINELEKYASNNLLKNRLLKNKNLPLIYIKNIYKKIRNIGWQVLYKYRRELVNFVKRRSKKIKRLIIKEKYKQAYTFAITCVKRIDYIAMVVKNINSLHYINPTHKFIVYCDNICYQELNKNKFDYPYQIEFNNLYSKGEKAWQYYKIETIIDASKKNYISIDADEIWYAEPKINKNKITFLVTSEKISDRLHECLVMEKVYNKKEWMTFNHYNTSFLSIPAKFMTEKLANDFRSLFTKLFNNSLNFITDKDKKNEIYRISEEIAINLAVQSNYKNNIIIPLKNIGDPKDTNIIQSLYYGCANRITD